MAHDLDVGAMQFMTDDLARDYVTAKRGVVDHGYTDEIAWQTGVAVAQVTRQSFLREAAWVVLSAGMRESVVRGVFPAMQSAFRQFNAKRLCEELEAARAEALAIFAHERKIQAVLDIASTVDRLTAAQLAERLADPQPFLESLPYVGPITWKHLAKNLGVQVAKPDRHLVRLAEACGRPSVESMCTEIAAWLGEPVNVVDVVLWRWAVLTASECGPTCHTPLPAFSEAR
jgi:hypothetical protein